MNSNERDAWLASSAIVVAIAVLTVAVAVLVHAVKSDQPFGVPGWILRVAEIILVIVGPILLAIGAGILLKKSLKGFVVVVRTVFVEAPKHSMLVPTLLALLASMMFAAAGNVVTSQLARVLLSLVPPLFTFFGTAAAEFGLTTQRRADLIGGVVLLLIPGAVLITWVVTVDWRNAYEGLSRTDRALLYSAASVYALAILFGLWILRSRKKRPMSREPNSVLRG